MRKLDSSSKKSLELVRREIIKVLYSDINDYKADMQIANKKLSNQLKEFRLIYNYKYPKFIMYTNTEEFYDFYALLSSGYTLAQVEEIYITIQLHSGEFEQKTKSL